MDKLEIDKDWCLNAAKREGDSEVGAGVLAMDCPECGCPSGGHNLGCSIWHKESLAEIARLRALLTETGQKLIAAEEAKRRALAIADERSKENVALRGALDQALRQWNMYADMVERNDGFNLATEKSPEGDMYRRAREALGQ